MEMPLSRQTRWSRSKAVSPSVKESSVSGRITPSSGTKSALAALSWSRLSRMVAQEMETVQLPAVSVSAGEPPQAVSRARHSSQHKRAALHGVRCFIGRLRWKGAAKPLPPVGFSGEFFGGITRPDGAFWPAEPARRRTPPRRPATGSGGCCRRCCRT